MPHRGTGAGNGLRQWLIAKLSYSTYLPTYLTKVLYLWYLAACQSYHNGLPGGRLVLASLV